jgi:RimJ/RimL family protein N-acetyltransferase
MAVAPFRADDSPVNGHAILGRAAFLERAAAALGRPSDQLDWHRSFDELGLDPIERYLLVRLALDAGVAVGPTEGPAADSLDDLHRLTATESAIDGFGQQRSASRRLAGQGSATWLRVPTTADQAWLHALLTHPAWLRWAPLAGDTPTPSSLVELLGVTSLCQFVIAANDTGVPVGWVRATAADLHNGHCYLEAAIDPDLLAKGWPLEGLFLFVDQLFADWGLRKIYAEVPDPQWQRLSLGTRRATLREGVLRRHRYVDGRHVDVHLVTVTRDGWRANRARQLGSAAR